MQIDFIQNEPFSLGYLDKQLKKLDDQPKLKKRAQAFIQILNQGNVNGKMIRSLAFFSLPDEIKGLRQLVWKLVLDYLPDNKTNWKSVVTQNRQTYEFFIEKYINCQEIVPLDDILDDIVKDTLRTRSEMHFFQQEVTSQYPFIIHEKNIDVPKTHQDILSRILFIYAKLNPGIQYVQGMNEILALIYYCFSQDVNEFFLENYEVDVFFCFTLLMGEIKDVFIRNLDHTNGGLQYRIEELNQLLKKTDLKLWNFLENLQIRPIYYSLRWLMLLLVMEFHLYDIMKIWDSLLSHPKKLDFLNYICLSILQNMKPKLMQCDFTEAMEIFKNIENMEISQVLQVAYDLYRQSSGEMVPKFLHFDQTTFQQNTKQNQEFVIKRKF